MQLLMLLLVLKKIISIGNKCKCATYQSLECKTQVNPMHIKQKYNSVKTLQKMNKQVVQLTSKFYFLREDIHRKNVFKRALPV